MYVLITLLPNKLWLIVAAVEGKFTFFFFYCFSTLTFKTPLQVYLWLWSVFHCSAHRQVLWKFVFCPETRLCLHLKYCSGLKMREPSDFQWACNVCMQTGGHQAEETFANLAIIIHSAASHVRQSSSKSTFWQLLHFMRVIGADHRVWGLEPPQCWGLSKSECYWKKFGTNKPFQAEDGEIYHPLIKMVKKLSVCNMWLLFPWNGLSLNDAYVSIQMNHRFKSKDSNHN